MNAWLPPSRLRLWAARLLAAAGAIAAVAPTFLAAAHASYAYPRVDLYPLRLMVDALALWLAGRRRFRFAAAVWFGCSAFFHLVDAVDRGSGGLWGFAAALPLALATALLVWPMLRAPDEQARLAPLSGVWVLVATLVVTAVDGVLSRGAGDLGRDAAFVAGASALALFAGCMIGSQLGPLRWLAQLGTVCLIGAAQTSDLRVFSGAALPAVDMAKLLTWLGLATFALGMDWIRAGAGSKARFLRAGALSLGVSLVPLALAALFTPVRLEVLAMAAGRAAALGLAAAIMPRVAGSGAKVTRVAGPVGRPPRALLGFAVAVLALGAFLLVFEHETIGPALLAMLPVAFCLVVRTRLTRAALFLMGGVAVMGVTFAGVKSTDVTVVAVAGLTAAAVFAFCISGPAAGKHFQRRVRWAPVPHPRVSVTLAGVAAAALLGPIAYCTIAEPPARSGLLAVAAGGVPLPEPLYFRPSVLRDAPSPGRLTGSPLAVDPLGRGTWVVDEERDEVALVGKDQQVKRFAVGSWPELLVVTREGRVFVSAREAARVDVIEPDFQRRAIELGDEVRGLALDPEEAHLYVGLITTRALESYDARTLKLRGHLDLPADPRSVAVTEAGVAALPDKGSALQLASADLRRRWEVELPSGDGVAWHGQALLPAGRDLLVLHDQVNTGLEHPVAGGGYGGSVSRPVELVATVVEGGRAPLVPPNARRTFNMLDLPDVSGAALGDGALFLASRIKGQVERVPFETSGRLDTASLRVDSPFQGEPGSNEESNGKVAGGLGMTGVALDRGKVISYAAFDRVLVSASQAASKHQDEVSLGKGVLDEQLALGRRLFFRDDHVISAAGLACASCHVDGREDGLVWRLQGARLQTPSLTGRLADTAPYNWHGTTKSLPDNISQTITRLGGSGLEKGDREALARYLSEGLRPVRPPPPSADPAVVAQGKALFHDRTVGCSGCHDPDSGFTDGQAHDVESLTAAEREELKRSLGGKEPEATAAAFDTPTLRQVGLTAPYFHDGSAKTLEDVVERNRDRMGKTSQLSAGERRALVAYLRTL